MTTNTGNEKTGRANIDDMARSGRANPARMNMDAGSTEHQKQHPNASDIHDQMTAKGSPDDLKIIARTFFDKSMWPKL